MEEEFWRKPEIRQNEYAAQRGFVESDRAKSKKIPGDGFPFPGG